MTPQELELTQRYARNTAYKILSSLPNKDQVVASTDDIVSDIQLTVMEWYHLYDPSRPFAPWLSWLIDTYRVDYKQKYFDSLTLYRSNHDTDNVVVTQYEEDGDGEISPELVMVDKNPNGEEACLQNEEDRLMAERIQVAQKDLQEMCKVLNLKYKPKDVIATLKNVLVKALNNMTDEEFHALPYHQQKKLTQWGDAVKDARLLITKNGKIKNKGIVAEVRALIREEGVTDQREIRRVFDKKGVSYQADSLATIVWDECKKAGVPTVKKHAVVKDRVRNLFDYGRGIVTVAEIALVLEAEGIKYTPSTLRGLVTGLRREFGITKHKVN